MEAVVEATWWIYALHDRLAGILGKDYRDTRKAPDGALIRRLLPQSGRPTPPSPLRHHPHHATPTTHRHQPEITKRAHTTTRSRLTSKSRIRQSMR
jgi:hypothetical protein